jgi:hypothetical protein
MARNKIFHFIKYTVGLRVTPLAYLFAGKAVVLGFIYAFVQSAGVRNMILFKQDAGVGIEFYGVFLFMGSLALIFAMANKNLIWTRTSGFFLLLISIWSMTVYIIAGYFDLAVISLFDVLGWAYIYLATYVGTLWDYKPDLDNHKPFV